MPMPHKTEGLQRCQTQAEWPPASAVWFVLLTFTLRVFCPPLLDCFVFCFCGLGLLTPVAMALYVCVYPPAALATVFWLLLYLLVKLYLSFPQEAGLANYRAAYLQINVLLYLVLQFLRTHIYKYIGHFLIS